jgi:ABC-type Fe3+-hydroxamate transport system substrate-binding protein
VTDYCVHPAEGVVAKPKLGGTKNPDVAAIVALRPDLVVANKEENRRRDVEALAAESIPVFVTYARGVREAIDEIRTLGRITGRASEADALAAPVEHALAAQEARATEPRVRCVALIWKDPFMVVGGDTFAHDLLRCCGADNPFAAAGDRRYPRVTRAELEAAQPEVILLPTEPYAFGEPDRRELLALDCPAAREGRIHVVEGELLSWYGPRMARALETFAALLRPAR